jgi:RHH-type transcriptional regulator, rel operon repressor / antitoxin RelB
MSTTMTVRLDPKLKKGLERLSDATQRSKSFLAADAIRQYLEINAWQIQEIKAAIAEADAGDFADDADLKAVTDKWHGRSR